ncbi:hypothetical protein IWW56_005779 [Coemansia sp. RSA 2131]|nr:hypothetical protein IWW56_005779 [Coemansia sp. RSA 2131]
MSFGGAEEFIELLIRSPSVATPDDFKIRVHSEQTISDVKTAIEQEHQATPLARHMRIIWKGRILRDEDSVKVIYESDERTARAQTVHFVLNAPDMARVITQKAESSSLSAQEQPVVVPLGNQFQYVLVDGVPYLRETRSLAYAQSTFGAQQRMPAVETQADRDAVARAHALQMRLMGQARGLDAVNAMTQYDQLREPARLNVREARPNVQEAARPDVRREANENAAQLAEMIRGFGFNTVWSFVWMLLRMLLLVVVLAHDASMGRMLVLAMAVLAVVVVRSAWAQQQLQRLSFGEHAEEEAEQREYTVVEKARALVVALVTSLVPSEPFQIPAPDA